MTDATQSLEEVITATLVPLNKRLDFLPRHFGNQMMRVENRIYDRFRGLCADYTGGYWEFYDLSNGGCYLAPRGEKFRIQQPNNYFDEAVSADAAGIIVTLYAMSELSFDYPNADVFSERFHQLRDFAAEHAESQLIGRAID